MSRALIDDYLDYYCWSIFASDKYGDHGLVGFVMVHRRSGDLRHFIFSCRVMHMGLENFALRVAKQTVPGIKVPGEWRERFGWSDADWIEETSYEDAETRQALFRHQGLPVAAAPEMRIMCACQSGGLAHYSQSRNAIDFDIWPRVFALRYFAQDDYAPDPAPPCLIYGAGTDYKDESWPDLAEQLDAGLYLACMIRLCEFVTANGIKLLVILPPENLPPHQYGPTGLTRERTITYNRLWRDAVQRYPLLVTLDVQAICEPQDMVDVNHHRPAALQNVSHWIDLWYSHVSVIPPEELAQAA